MSSCSWIRVVRQCLRAIVALACASVTPVAVAPLGAQQNATTCRSCSIRLSEVGVIGPGLDSVGGVGPALVGVSSDGRYLLPSAYSPGRVLVLGSKGELIATIGRQGQGPGEFAQVSQVVVSGGDTVHVFDNRLARRSIFSPDYVFVRSDRLPGRVHHALALGRGQFVLNASFPTSGGEGYPLHILDSAGRVTDSFGLLSPDLPASGGPRMRRFLAAARSGGFWAAWSQEYTIEHWSQSGDLLQTIHLDPAWFRADGPGRATAPVIPSLSGLHEDADGILWVYANALSDDWERHTEVYDQATGLRRITDSLKAFNTRIEALDPQSGTVIASEEIPGQFSGLTESGLLITRSRDEYDVVTLHLNRVTLSESGGSVERH